MKKPLLTLLTIVAALGVSTGAFAQNNSLFGGGSGIQNAGQLLRNYDVETLVPILQELGMKWEGRTGPTGKILLVTSPDGLKFVMVPTACQAGANQGCVGLNMIALFSGNADYRTVNSFNYRYAFSSAGIDDSGTAYIGRYEIADYGVPKGNLIVSMAVFLSQAGYFGDTLNTASRTVSTTPSPDDLAANALNMPDLATMTTHQAGFEQTREMVKVLVQAEQQSPGKIANFTK